MYKKRLRLSKKRSRFWRLANSVCWRLSRGQRHGLLRTCNELLVVLVLVKFEGVLSSQAIVLQVAAVVGLREHLFDVGEQDPFFLIKWAGLVLDLFQIHSLSPFTVMLSLLSQKDGVKDDGLNTLELHLD